MNCTSPDILDAWIAHEIWKSDKIEEATKGSGKKHVSMDEVAMHMNSKVK
jgi:hypothetical protein